MTRYLLGIFVPVDPDPVVVGFEAWVVEDTHADEKGLHIPVGFNVIKLAMFLVRTYSLFVATALCILYRLC